ncbi:PQQ-binding-like beta-propeller repeat protein [bacterium]|nr:PQQ-binding-like beta-propeller repeat protein [bacterium]
MSRIIRLALGLFPVLFAAACSSGLSGQQASPEPPLTVEWTAPATEFPLSLPQDAMQPWEEVARDASAIDAGSEFTAGRDWFMASPAGVSENGEAARIEAAAGESSYGIWRVPLAGNEPGTLSIDANLLESSQGDPSEYYLAVANYGTGRWDWQGPFTDSHVRLSLAESLVDGGSFLSSANSIFVTVLVSNGNSLDVVGLGLNAYDDTDTEAPPQVTGLAATPVSGGLELQWNPVVADDLAGYIIFHSGKDFINPVSAGVKRVDYLEGSTRQLLSGLIDPTFIRIAALDHSGNMGPTSELLEASPLEGDALTTTLLTDIVSGQLNSVATLTASGADSYDWDTNGDGIFDISGDTSGEATADTSATGIIRPRVRATGSAGEAVALGAVSLIITGNSRPLASATASPQSGQAPLDVTFTGTAEDGEDDIEALSFAWDFDGDGIYEADTDTLTPDPQNYTNPGIYNVKLRVTDSQGASDVDTVSVLVQEPDAPANELPTAMLQFDENSGDAPLTVNFSAFGSVDPDGNIVEYAWDWDGDGLYDAVGESTNASHVYTEPGIFTMRLRVEDNDGGRDTTTLEITVNVAGNLPPSAVLDSDKTTSYAPFEINFDASASMDSDGSIVKYEWDFDGDGGYEESGEGAAASYVYPVHGRYIASLRVTDDKGAQATDSFVINLPSEYPTYGGNPQRLSPWNGTQSNSQKWFYPTGGDIRSSAAIASDGTIYICSYDGKLYALDPLGNKLWDYDGGAATESTPVIGPDGSIFFGNYNGNVIRVDSDGNMIWTHSGPSFISSAMSISDAGVVYVAMNDDLRAINPDGSLYWTYSTGGDVRAASAIGKDGTIYFGSNDNHLYALRPDGSLKWKYDSNGVIQTIPAIAPDGRIIIGESLGDVTALNQDGSISWSYSSGADQITSTPAVSADGRICIGTSDPVGGRLLCLDADGSFLWEYSLNDPVWGPAMFGADGIAYSGCSDNLVYAINPDGTLNWSFNTGGFMQESGPVIGPDGTVYIGTFNNRLYAIGD